MIAIINLMMFCYKGCDESVLVVVVVVVVVVMAMINIRVT